MDHGRILSLFGWLSVLASLGGCAHTAQLNAWKPAEVDVTGISRLTVMEFTGPEGKAVSSALAAKLWQSEFFTLIDHTRARSSSTLERPVKFGQHALALNGSAVVAGVSGGRGHGRGQRRGHGRGRGHGHHVHSHALSQCIAHYALSQHSLPECKPLSSPLDLTECISVGVS